MNESQSIPAERKHHKFGPSRLNYLASCAAFTNTDSTTEAAEEGTALHEIMEQLLKNVSAKKFKTTLEQLNSGVLAGQELTDEQRDYLRFCCKQCDKFIIQNPVNIVVEINLQIRDSTGTKELNHGFLDVAFIFANNVAIIQDFKFGWEPVKPANINLQGKNYAVGVFQLFRQLDKVGVQFIQPKLNYITSAIFKRTDMPALYEEIAEVISKAEDVQLGKIKPENVMVAGSYCKYCALASTCTTLANYRGLAVSKMENLPAPISFKGIQLSKPEDIALARYWVDVIETGVDEVKKKALEIAEANGGEISCTLPDGTVVCYEVREKNTDRKLGNALEVADTFKEFVTLEQILSLASLPLGPIETLLKEAVVENAKLQEQKLTKKAALEQVTATLEANGLITRPDGKIRFLKRAVKTNQTKQIEEPKQTV